MTGSICEFFAVRELRAALGRTSRRGFVAFAIVAFGLVPIASGSGTRSSPEPNAYIVRTTVRPVWPAPSRIPSLETLGSHIAVVFSPDLSVPSNRSFYEKLGFVYVEDASWDAVLGTLERYNADHPDSAVDTVFVTSHGANGNGLKLQSGHEADSPRSYVSIGGLQERLGGAGIRRCVLAACNTSRLFRPSIYNRLDRTVQDPLFAPATAGIVDASENFDPSKSDVEVIRRADNQKENTSEGAASELSPEARKALGLGDARASKSVRFVVSDLFVQMLSSDPSLQLTSKGYVSNIVLEGADNERSDRYFRRFVRTIDEVARGSAARLPTLHRIP